MTLSEFSDDITSTRAHSSNRRDVLQRVKVGYEISLRWKHGLLFPFAFAPSIHVAVKFTIQFVLGSRVRYDRELARPESKLIVLIYVAAKNK
jgi:hypothetical protein